MKVIVAGSRSITDTAVVEAAITASEFVVTELVSGAARGVDRLGAAWARARGIPVKLFPAEWDRLGKAAGFVRNQQMAEYADALVAVWDGASAGTTHMIEAARRAHRLVYVHRTDGRSA